jgi:hypothetical protein
MVMSCMRWNETRAGTTSASAVSAGNYLRNEFNSDGSDGLEARPDLPFVYACSGGSLTQALRYDFLSATNGQNPQTFDKVILNGIASANLEIGNNPGVYDFRSNSLKNVYKANENITSRVTSSGTTSEDIYTHLFVTDKPFVTNSIGQRVDKIIRSTFSGTVGEDIANFALTPDNELEAGSYRILKVDAVSRGSACDLIYGEIVMKGIELGVPFIPRTAPKQNIHPINNLPIDEPIVFNSVNNFPSISLSAGNSATNDVDITFFLQRVE